MTLEKDIREEERAGIQVTVINSQGKITYRTDQTINEDECDSCEFLRLLPDPDPHDWFCSDNMQAYCQEAKKTIARGLRPHETTHIQKKLWCPHLGRELTDEEKKTLSILQKHN